MASTMRAVQLSKPSPDSAPSLTLTSLPIPTPAQNELLIRIHASPVLPSDILNSKGSFALTTFPRIPGRDFAGTVAVSSSAVWPVGTKVYGSSGNTFSFSRDGAHAEYAVVPADGVARMPEGLSFAQAASVGTNFLTALMGLRRTRVEKGEVVCVLGGTGAVGSAVCKIAGVVMGCRVVSVARHGGDVSSVEDPGLEGVKAWTEGGRGPDVVFDTVGELALTKAALGILAPMGRLLTITAPRVGSTELGVDLLGLYRREVELVGCNSVSKGQGEMAAMLEELRPWFEDGKLVATEEREMTLVGMDRAVEAYEGKVKKAVIVFD